jgi:FMN phosphatase YigB (HAD superfamily)
LVSRPWRYRDPAIAWRTPKTWVAGIRILTEVDAVVDAARLGIRKPDPGAYRAALDVLAVTAPDVVFVAINP